MEIPENLPNYYKPLSLRLWRVLDNIGVSEDIRKARVEVATNWEILASIKARFAYNPKTIWYIFGSYSEGTTTFGCYFFDYNKKTLNNLGLFSDVDFLVSIEDLQVVQDTNEAPAGKTSFLLVTDEETKPGYVKLQLIKNGAARTADSVAGTEFTYTPNAPRTDRKITYRDLANRDNTKYTLTYIEDEISEGERLFEDYNALLTWKIDSKDRIVVVNRPGVEKQLDTTGFHTIHGPALTTKAAFGWQAVDMVYAYKCHKWLSSNRNWLGRSRKYNWPSAEMINEMDKLGFFVVPVGHPNSGEQNKEWRISFSLQERLLVQNFNPTQYKCYVLLKFIRKEIILHFITEESLSSYHLKTCIFYMIENIPYHMWQPENLLACVEGSLKCLLNWTKEGVCPNYFIPEENMFEKRIHGPLQSKLLEVLETLLSSSCGFLLHLRRDDIGPLLRQACKNRTQEQNKAGYKSRALGALFLDECRALMDIRSELIHRFKQFHVENCCNSLYSIISQLKTIETIAGHTKEQTQKAVSLLLPYLEINLMSNLVVRETAKENNAENVRDYLMSNKWNEVSALSDYFTAKLKQATLLHAMEYYRASLEILYEVEKMTDPWITVLCSCRHKPKIMAAQVTRRIQQSDLSIDDLRHKIWAPCSVFTQSEKEFVSLPLRYEMTRSHDMEKPASYIKELRNESFWYDSAVVDNKFYLYFLLYLNHYKLGKPSETAIDIDSMQLLLATDPCLRHLETDMNLLAWVYKQEGMKDKAVGGFKTSLSLQNTYNAAVRHLKEILMENSSESL